MSKSNYYYYYLNFIALKNLTIKKNIFFTLLNFIVVIIL